MEQGPAASGARASAMAHQVAARRRSSDPGRGRRGDRGHAVRRQDKRHRSTRAVQAMPIMLETHRQVRDQARGMDIVYSVHWKAVNSDVGIDPVGCCGSTGPVWHLRIAAKGIPHRHRPHHCRVPCRPWRCLDPFLIGIQTGASSSVERTAAS